MNNAKATKLLSDQRKYYSAHVKNKIKIKTKTNKQEIKTTKNPNPAQGTQSHLSELITVTFKNDHYCSTEKGLQLI